METYLEKLNKELKKIKKKDETFLVGKIKTFLIKEEKTLKYVNDELLIGLLAKEFFHALDDTNSMLKNMKAEDKIADNTLRMTEEFNKLRLL